MATRKEVRVGDLVRSYDHPWVSTTEYIVGRVEKIDFPPCDRDCERYHVRVERHFVRGQEITDSPLIGRLVYPPVNGTPTFRGPSSGVERIIQKRETV